MGLGIGKKAVGHQAARQRLGRASTVIVQEDDPRLLAQHVWCSVTTSRSFRRRARITAFTSGSSMAVSPAMCARSRSPANAAQEFRPLAVVLSVPFAIAREGYPPGGHFIRPPPFCRR